MALVTDQKQDDDVLVPQYQLTEVAAGSGSENGDSKPTDYVTFKQSWLKRKSLDPASLVVIYARGDSMADRVQDGDVILVNTAEKTVRDGCIYAFVYGDVARLKRLRVRINGSIALVSDNDPDGSLREELSRETLDQLHIIGRAVWVGGDLN